jgi:hypothetical protein
MSRKIGLDTLFLRPTPRLAHTEYSMGYHTSYLQKLGKSIEEAWDFDFNWCVNDGPVNWGKEGRITDMGHAVYASDGSDQRAPAVCPFTDVEEIFEFDPIKEYGMPGHRELVRHFEDWYQKSQAACPEQVVTGGRYNTVVSGAIQIFGWDMLLEAAGTDPDRFAKVLQRIGEYSIMHAQAWAETSIEAYIQHDDMVWTAGPFMDPKYYRAVIFPLYKRMWDPLRKAGKKVLFCSDGTFDMFMDDVSACGAEGFIFEPTNDLDWVCKRFGKTHAIVGSKADCRTMAMGTWEQVKAEMDATLVLAKKCPGFMWAVGNHIPANVSDEMCDRYMNYLRANWKR